MNIPPYVYPWNILYTKRLDFIKSFSHIWDYIEPASQYTTSAMDASDFHTGFLDAKISVALLPFINGSVRPRRYYFDSAYAFYHAE